MTLEIDIKFNYKNNRQIAKVKLAGSLDTKTAPDLEKQLDGIFQPSFKMLIFDLKFLNFISSAGLRVVFKTAKQAREEGGTVFVINRQPQIVKVFEIVKALPSLKIFASDQEMDEFLLEIMENKQ